jgi:hypothetical protein
LVRNPFDHEFVCDTLAGAGRQVVDKLSWATFLQKQGAAVDLNSKNQQQQEPLHCFALSIYCKKFLHAIIAEVMTTITKAIVVAHTCFA